MVAPSFSELGKKTCDVLCKNYNDGYCKIDSKIKCASGMEYNLSGKSSIENSNVDVSLSSKYGLKAFGADGFITSKWQTNNTLTGEIKFNDLLTKGTNLSFETEHGLLSGAKKHKLTTGYKQEYLNLNMNVNFGKDIPKIALTGACMYKNWVVGGKLCSDAKFDKPIISSDVGLGYITKNFEFATIMKDCQEVSSSIHHIHNSKWKSGIKVSWNMKNSSSKVAYGCLYQLDADTTLRAKVNNSGQIGLGMSHDLKSNLTLHLSTLLNTKTFSQGGHKAGFGLQISN